MSKVTNLAPWRDRTLLSKSLTKSREAVLVPTLPGYLMFWPAIVMRVRLGSALSGRKVQTTFEKAISFQRSMGMFLYRMVWKGFVPSTRCLEGSAGLTPMNLDGCARASASIQMTPPSNVWKAQKPSTPSGTRTPPPRTQTRDRFLKSCLHLPP